MAVASETVTVNHPIGDTFDFLADGSRNALWRPTVDQVVLASGPASSAVWVQSIRGPSGRLRKADYRVTHYDRPGALELTVVSGPSRPTTALLLKSLAPGSTSVTYTVDVKPLFWPLARTSLGSRDAEAEAANILNLPAAMADNPGGSS